MMDDQEKYSRPAQILSPRVIFMGSPAFAVPALGMLSERPDLCQVVAVVTQPDKPAGRGRNLMSSAVKVAAEARGIPVLQPKKMKASATAATLAELAPDLVVVAAYGRILPPALLAIPRLGCINLHASLLPRYRGASPIAHAILNGDEETGVAVMRMEEGLDTGPVYAERRLRIDAADTCFTLTVKLAILGADLLSAVFADIAGGQLHATAQRERGMTYAPLLSKADGELDFRRGAVALSRQLRAHSPWPGSFAILHRAQAAQRPAQRIHIIKAEVVERAHVAAPGEVVSCDKRGIEVACAGSLLRLCEVKPAGKKVMPANAWSAGRGVSVGDRFAPV